MSYPSSTDCEQHPLIIGGPLLLVEKLTVDALVSAVVISSVYSSVRATSRRFSPGPEPCERNHATKTLTLASKGAVGHATVGFQGLSCPGIKGY